MRTIVAAVRHVLSRKRYAIGFALLAPVVGLLLFLLPVWLTPGNSISFQASFFRPQDWVLTTLLAVAMALMLTMQVYAFALVKSATARMGSIGSTAVGGFAGVMAAMFADRLVRVVRRRDLRLPWDRRDSLPHQTADFRDRDRAPLHARLALRRITECRADLCVMRASTIIYAADRCACDRSRRAPRRGLLRW